MKTSVARIFGLVLALSILAGIVILIVRPDATDAAAEAFRPRPLGQTMIVPTPSAPLPPGKNVLWCASFQMAWDRLKADVAHGPILLEPENAVAAALNGSTIAEGELPPGSFYASAGLDPGLFARIREDMARLFPNVAVDLPPGHGGLAAYAYLKAGLKFDLPYFDAREPLAFREASGAVKAVNAFGIRPEDDYAYMALRRQVEIVYAKEAPRRSGDPEEFIIDPCRTSTPSQILLAAVPRKATLKETWEDVRSKLLPNGQPLGPNDTLLVPNITCDLVQDFDALTGSSLAKPGLEGKRIDVARQAIQFRLNRGGAELGSEAKVYMLPIPTHYHFDRPFLLAMRKRGAATPYFLIWVDTAEVLQ